LEFAPGGELFDFLMFTGCFSEEAARTYLYQFLNGLEAMHKLGIAHRDLKPENLLMDADYNLKIADFGFATEFLSQDGSQIMMQTACGTKGYLAPELLKGKKYTQKCDLFAVGIILFTTYAGFPPFQNAVDTDWWWEKLLKGWGLFESAKTTEDKKEKATMEQKSKEKFELFWKAHERSRQFSDDLKELCVNILHPNPKMRYDIPDVRKHQWYRGKIYNTEEIKKYMEKRIRLVMKERALKQDYFKEQMFEAISFILRMKYYHNEKLAYTIAELILSFTPRYMEFALDISHNRRITRNGINALLDAGERNDAIYIKGFKEFLVMDRKQRNEIALENTSLY